MKKVTAFLTAFVLMVITAVGLHFYANDKLEFNNNEFGSWMTKTKFISPDAIGENLNKDSVLVLGSSELGKNLNTPFHPRKMFQGNTLNLMLIGAGYYQSLTHATTLAAVAPEMKNKKVVLMLSPQWFRKKGVEPDAYASNFSENSFIGAMENPNIGDDIKEYMIERSKTLMESDETTRKRIELYERVFIKKNATALDSFQFMAQKAFLKEKEQQSVVALAALHGLKHDKNENLQASEPDWNEYLQLSDIDGKKKITNNDFNVEDSIFNRNVKPRMKKMKNKNPDGSYSESKEYKDLQCFLDVCKELDIKPLLVMMPINGKWYDYTGFTKEKRVGYYQNIRTIAAEYGAELADFSDQEYTDYFLNDTVHLGGKGWVYVNKSIYNYSKEDEK